MPTTTSTTTSNAARKGRRFEHQDGREYVVSGLRTEKRAGTIVLYQPVGSRAEEIRKAAIEWFQKNAVRRWLS